jgi:hypothetical protein
MIVQGKTYYLTLFLKLIVAPLGVLVVSSRRAWNLAKHG